MDLQETIEMLLACHVPPQPLDTFTGVLTFYFDNGIPTEVASLVSPVDGKAGKVHSARVELEDAPPPVYRLFHELWLAQAAIEACADLHDTDNALALGDRTTKGMA